MSAVEVVSPVTGAIWKLQCAEGDEVSVGQELMIVESMKTEFLVTAEIAGRIVGLSIQEGASVEEDAVLCRIEGA